MLHKVFIKPNNTIETLYDHSGYDCESRDLQINLLNIEAVSTFSITLVAK